MSDACLVARSGLILCNPMDCSLPGFSVHGIFQARILEWVANFLILGIFPTPGIEPTSPVFPALQVGSLPAEPSGKPLSRWREKYFTAMKYFRGQLGEGGRERAGPVSRGLVLLFTKSFWSPRHWRESTQLSPQLPTGWAAKLAPSAVRLLSQQSWAHSAQRWS